MLFAHSIKRKDLYDMNGSRTTSHSSSHRQHHPIRAEQQLALVADPSESPVADDDWVVDSGSRRVGLDAIHRARHLLDAAAEHDAAAAAKRSQELRRPIPAGPTRLYAGKSR